MIYFPNKFFKKKLTANEMFAKLGFTIDQDNPRFGTHYSRYNARYGYLHKVSIIYKHPLGIEKPYILVQSYQYDNDAMVGLTDAEMEACMAKIKEMKDFAIKNPDVVKDFGKTKVV